MYSCILWIRNLGGSRVWCRSLSDVVFNTEVREIAPSPSSTYLLADTSIHRRISSRCSSPKFQQDFLDTVVWDIRIQCMHGYSSLGQPRSLSIVIRPPGGLHLYKHSLSKEQKERTRQPKICGTPSLPYLHASSVMIAKNSCSLISPS